MTEKTIQPNEFELWRDMIRSGQIDQSEVPKLLDANPEFKAWYLKRASLIQRLAKDSNP